MLKRWKQFEANITPQIDELNLKEFFDIELNDIKEWIQDFLDDHLDLNLEIQVINKNIFFINLVTSLPNDGFLRGNVTKEKYPISDDLVNYLNSRLNEFNCFLVEYPKSKTIAYYSLTQKYISFRVQREVYSYPKMGTLDLK